MDLSTASPLRGDHLFPSADSSLYKRGANNPAIVGSHKMAKTFTSYCLVVAFKITIDKTRTPNTVLFYGLFYLFLIPYIKRL